MKYFVILITILASVASAQTIDNTIKGRNYSGGTTVTIPTTATLFVGCNFSFPQPRVLNNGTTVPKALTLDPDGFTTATFFRCNFVNARPVEGSRAIKCNTTLVARTLWTGTKQLQAVLDNGTTITKTIKTYSNVIYGRGVYTPQTYQVNYLPTPKMLVADPPEGSRAARIQARYDDWLESRTVSNDASAAMGEIE